MLMISHAKQNHFFSTQTIFRHHNFVIRFWVNFLGTGQYLWETGPGKLGRGQREILQVPDNEVKGKYGPGQ